MNGDAKNPAGRESGPSGPGPSRTGQTGTIFLFETTHDAMRAEEAIIEGGFWCDVVPRPPDSASTLCGLAIEVEPADSGDVARLLEGEGIKYEIYQPVGT